VKFQYIAEYRGSLTRSHLCHLMGVTERGFRAWKHRPPSHRQRRDMVLLVHIRDQHRLSLGSYGRPRMTEELNELGLRVGQRCVGRVRQENDPPDRFQNLSHCARTAFRSFERGSSSAPPTAITSSTSRRISCSKTSRRAGRTKNGQATSPLSGLAKYEPGQKTIWEIVFPAIGVYLAVILDLFSRRVVGWAVSNRIKQDLALRALNMAIALRRPPPGCIHHLDRGSQYCARDYQKLLRKHGLTPSMSGKGNCYDNSAVESVFKSLKAELVWRRNWQTRREVEVALFGYINGFYNPRRRHSAIGWKSPVAFEQKAA
jgi:putative transposase